MAGLILGVLGSGFALGVAADRIWLRPRQNQEIASSAPKAPRPKGEARERLLTERFKTGLELDEEQTRLAALQIRLMLKELDAIRTQSRSELKRVRDTRRTEIMKLLRPEQQSRFREMIDSYERRQAERRREGRDRW
ncbi:MAG: hypothetical protein PHV85_10515 [Desulfovibrionaceae bacterium]|nr:hypothetical protein [Desulfovibrionaceae bacterium]